MKIVRKDYLIWSLIFILFLLGCHTEDDKRILSNLDNIFPHAENNDLSSQGMELFPVDSIAFNYYLSGRTASFNYQFDSSMLYLIEGIGKLDSSHPWYTTFLKEMARISWYRRDHFSGIIYADLAISLENKKSTPDPVTIAQCLEAKGKLIRKFGNKDQGEILIDQGISLLESVDASSTHLQSLYSLKATISANNKNWITAEHYISKGIQVWKPQERIGFNPDRLMGFVHFLKGDLNESKRHYTNFLESHNIPKDKHWIDESNYVLTEIHLKNKEYEKAKIQAIKNYYDVKVSAHDKKYTIEDFLHVPDEKIDHIYIVLLNHLFNVYISRLDEENQLSKQWAIEAVGVSEKLKELFKPKIIFKEDAALIAMQSEFSKYKANLLRLYHYEYLNSGDVRLIGKLISQLRFGQNLIFQKERFISNRAIKYSSEWSQNDKVKISKIKHHYAQYSQAIDIKYLKTVSALLFDKTRSEYSSSFDVDLILDPLSEYRSIYISGDSKDIFVLKEGTAFNRIGIDEELKKSIIRVLEELKGREHTEMQPEFLRNLNVISNKVLDKVRPFKENEAINFIVDGTLSEFPLGILLNEKTDATAYVELPYLAKNSDVTYSFIEKQNKDVTIAIDKKDPILSYSYSSKQTLLKGSARELPGAYREQQYLKENYDNVKTYAGSKANRSSFIKEDYSKYKMLHIGIHTDVDPGDVYNSKVIFNGAQDVLWAYELLDKNTDTDIVLLNSCRSGSGPMVDSEGVFSLTRFFLQGGSKKVISSLWDVEDSFGIIFLKSLISENQVNPLFNHHPGFWGSYQVWK